MLKLKTKLNLVFYLAFYDGFNIKLIAEALSLNQIIGLVYVSPKLTKKKFYIKIKMYTFDWFIYGHQLIDLYLKL